LQVPSLVYKKQVSQYQIWCFLLQGRRDVYEYFRNLPASVFRVEEMYTVVLGTYFLCL